LPFSVLYFLATFLIAASIFVLAYYKRGLKLAVILSTLSFGVSAAIFLVFLSLALNTM